MRHVVIISSSGELGGGELSLLPVLSDLARRARVTLMTPAAGPLEVAGHDEGAEIDPSFRLSARVRASSGMYGVGGPRTTVSAAASQFTLARAFRGLRPDLVYCNGTRAQVAASAAGRSVGARVVWHVRDFARAGPVGVAWRAAALLPATIIANSHATAEQPALRHVRRRVRAIPNGIDLDRFRFRPSAAEGAPTIGMAAHLTPWKGHERFIHVVQTLLPRHPDLQAQIAGAAHYDTAGNAGFRGRLERLIAELGLKSVCRLEHVPPAAMPDWLAGLSVLVHCPDRPEPFGRVLAEAMAVGVPVVAAASGGALEVVGAAGITIAPRDEARVVEAVSGLLRDPAQRDRLARLGRERAELCHDERRYVAATIRALEQA